MSKRCFIFSSVQVFVAIFFLSLLFFSPYFGSKLTAQQEKQKLNKFEGNIFSQFGEDGIVSKIFEIIGSRSKVCVEFGAWDGFYLSNTANLWSSQGWKGILIECDQARMNQLISNVKGYDCVPICAKVGIGENSLEAILSKNRLGDKLNIDLLSIDIDSDDYHVFQSLKSLRPRVVICEYNPSFPAHLDIYPEFGKNHMGCSPAALIRVAKEKGYSLVAITVCNCFFVRDDEISKFESYETSLEKLRIDRSLRYIVTDYDGKYALIVGEDFVNPYGISGPLSDRLQGSVQKLDLSLVIRK